MKVKSMFKLKSIKNPLISYGLFVLLFFLITSNCFGQSITWQRTLGSGYGNVNRVRQLNTGDYIILGNERINSQNKIHLTKIDALGSIIWIKILGTGESAGWWLEETNDKGFIIGASSDLGTSSTKGYLIKTDTAGNIMWTRTFEYSDLDQIRCVKQTSDDGYLLSVRVWVGLFNAVWIIKTDSLGNTIWEKIISDTNRHLSCREIIDLRTGYIICGGIYDNAAGSSDAWIYKLSNSGDSLNSLTFGGTNTDVIYSVDTLGMYGLIFGGYSSSTNSHGESYLIKSDMNLNFIWQKTYSGNYGEICYSLKHKRGYGYILAGYSDTQNITQSRALVRIVDTNGVEIRQKTFFPGNRGGDFYDVDLCNDGGYILGGASNTNSAVSLYVAKTDSLFYADPIGISVLTNSIPIDYSISQNYPNPFNPSTKIKFQIPAVGTDLRAVSLNIFDISGRLVKTILQQSLKPGSYEISVDASGLASSVYFYRLEVSDPSTGSGRGYLETKKMVLIK